MTTELESQRGQQWFARLVGMAMDRDYGVDLRSAMDAEPDAILSLLRDGLGTKTSPGDVSRGIAAHFDLGSIPADADEGVRRKVRMTNGFKLAMLECSRAQGHPVFRQETGEFMIVTPHGEGEIRLVEKATSCAIAVFEPGEPVKAICIAADIDDAVSRFDHFMAARNELAITVRSPGM